MIGLEFITQTFNVKYATIAATLNVNRTTVHDWVTGKRKIPRERLKQLAEYFQLGEEYFQKELNPAEKLHILRQKVVREYEKINTEDATTTMEETIIDDDGNEQTAFFDYFDGDIEFRLNLKTTEIKKLELLKKVENLLNLENVDYTKLPDINRDIMLLEDFIKILSSDKIDNDTIHKTLWALAQAYEIDKRFGFDDDPLVSKLVEIYRSLLKG